jgi:metallo-beta-lactamase class B
MLAPFFKQSKKFVSIANTAARRKGETMKRQVLFAAAIATTALLCSPPTRAQSNDTVTQHVAAATIAAKSDLLGPLALCKTASSAPVASFMDSYNRLVKDPPLAPMQVMDELYFLGNAWTAAWAVRTSQGIIVIDALDNADEAKQYIEGGLQTLGLNPADIKYVVVSHAHGDHYGGANYLKEKFGAHVVMSEIDWKVFDDPQFDPKRNALFDPPPKRDVAVKDGETLKLGDTTLTFHVIPGHTLGTLATVFTVHDHGDAHNAVAWGGTAYNFGPLPDRLQTYADTTARYREMLKQAKVDVFLSNHVNFDAAVAKMAALKARKAGDPNPFVVGSDTVQRFLTVLGECALATKAYVEAGQPK